MLAEHAGLKTQFLPTYRRYLLTQTPQVPVRNKACRMQCNVQNSCNRSDCRRHGDHK